MFLFSYIKYKSIVSIHPKGTKNNEILERREKDMHNVCRIAVVGIYSYNDRVVQNF